MPAPKWLREASRIRPLPGRTEKPLHLFRALIRECTYLPDSAARIYMRHHIISRYKAYQPKSQLEEQQYVRPLLAQRFTHVNKTARKGLAQLQKANAGHFSPLLKVLFMTYGRLGKRRYELLEPLKHADTESAKSASDMITRKLMHVAAHPSTKEKTPRLSSQLQALLQSQRKMRPPHNYIRTKQLKHVELDIPKENIWLDHTPQKRVVNIVQQWYGEMLDKTLPPLPEAEWLRLQRLAWGQEREHIIRRRPSSSQIEDDEICSNPVSLLGRGLQQELGLKPKLRPISTLMPHELTPRYMRRLWLKVFDLCPTMTWDMAHGTWKIRWGCSPAEKPGSTSKRGNNARFLKYLEVDNLHGGNVIIRDHT